MQKVNPKIDDIKIISSHIDIERNRQKNINVQVDFQAKVGFPEDENDNSFLLNVVMNVHSNDTQEIRIAMESDILISVESKPEDFEEMMKKECLPIVSAVLCDKLDNILVECGYSKLNLSK